MTQQQSSLLSLAVCVLLVSVIFIPSILFFSFTLLPTLMLAYFDKDPEQIKTKAIGSLNIVGTAHAVNYSLVTYGSINSLSILLRDLTNWVLPLGLALLGFIIYRNLPAVIRIWADFWINRKETLLKERQAKIIEEWGDKVRGNLGFAPHEF